MEIEKLINWLKIVIANSKMILESEEYLGYLCTNNQKEVIENYTALIDILDQQMQM